MRLTRNFTLEEFTVSQTAARQGIDNTIPKHLIKNVLRCAYTLEILRLEVNRPIVITSGYRSPRLNLAVGGSENSWHMQGLAVDFIVPGLTIEQVIDKAKNIVGYDQLINEFGRWVHLGLSDRHRNQVFDIK